MTNLGWLPGSYWCWDLWCLGLVGLFKIVFYFGLFKVEFLSHSSSQSDSSVEKCGLSVSVSRVKE